MLSSERIKKITEKIIKSVSPERIILFGSYANNTATEDSDIDIFVVWETDLSPHKRNLFLSRLFPVRNFSLDILGFTKSEVNRFQDTPGTIVYEAIHNGKILYQTS